jgi:hypothetical protein
VKIPRSTHPRSFSSDDVVGALAKLLLLPNCQGWLSVDRENYKKGLEIYTSSEGWKVALLQEAPDVMPQQMIDEIARCVKPGDLVSFPYHHGGRHVEPVSDARLLVCPQVLGTYPLETRKHVAKPCQLCGFCLP